MSKDFSPIPLNFSMEVHDGSEKERTIVRLSWKVCNAKKYKDMTEKQRQNILSMIDRFEASLKATKKQLKP